MEPTLLYGVPHGCSFGAIVALEWLGRPYRLCRIDMNAQLDDAVFSRASPLKLTPVLQLPSGEILTESFAILQHIAAKDLGKRLAFPQGTIEQDRLNAALAFLVTGFHGAWGPIFQPAKYAGADQAAQIEVRDRAVARARQGYARLEALLEDRDWLTGEHRTIADAYLAGVARWGEDLAVIDIAADYPRVQALLQRLEADPAVKFAHDIEEDRPAVTAGGFLGHVALADLAPRLAAA